METESLKVINAIMQLHHLSDDEKLAIIKTINDSCEKEIQYAKQYGIIEKDFSAYYGYDTLILFSFVTDIKNIPVKLTFMKEKHGKKILKITGEDTVKNNRIFEIELTSDFKCVGFSFNFHDEFEIFHEEFYDVKKILIEYGMKYYSNPIFESSKETKKRPTEEIISKIKYLVKDVNFTSLK